MSKRRTSDKLRPPVVTGRRKGDFSRHFRKFWRWGSRQAAMLTQCVIFGNATRRARRRFPGCLRNAASAWPSAAWRSIRKTGSWSRTTGSGSSRTSYGAGVERRRRKTNQTFVRNQQQGQLHGRPESGLVSRHLMNGVGRCFECGGPLIFVHRGGKHAHRYYGSHRRETGRCKNGRGILKKGTRRRSTATARRAALGRRRVTLALARRAHREVEEGHCAAGSGCREHSGGTGPDRRRSRTAGRCARRRE